MCIFLTLSQVMPCSVPTGSKVPCFVSPLLPWLPRTTSPPYTHLFTTILPHLLPPFTLLLSPPRGDLEPLSSANKVRVVKGVSYLPEPLSEPKVTAVLVTSQRSKVLVPSEVCSFQEYLPSTYCLPPFLRASQKAVPNKTEFVLLVFLKPWWPSK